MRRWLGPVSALALGVACVGEATAQNLLKNERFDKDLSSWQALETYGRAPGQSAWSPSDSDGLSNSGSLELRTSALTSRETYSVGQCVAIPTPSEYAVFGGKIRVPSGQPAAGFASLSLEYFPSADCSGPGGSQSGLERLANADYWSKRTEFANIQGASSLRLIASCQKRYEWQEGDQTGEIDDHVTFQSFFDDLFVYVTSEANLTKLVHSLPTDIPEYRSSNQATASWGKNTVERPTLSVKVLADNGTERGERVIELTSLEQIRLSAHLTTHYSYDDPQWYPLQNLSLSARNNQQNFGRRPTLEILLYRAGDLAKNPAKIAIDESGSGAASVSLTLNLTGASEFRVRTLRALYTCLTLAYPNVKRPDKDPSDEQLLATPLAEYFVANPPGDYELVAKYFALEAGFWHDPVYSEPLRIKIVKKDVECAAPQRLGAGQQ